MDLTRVEQSEVQSYKAGHISRNLLDQHESAVASESRPKSIAVPSVVPSSGI